MVLLTNDRLPNRHAAYAYRLGLKATIGALSVPRSAIVPFVANICLRLLTQ